MSGFSEQTESTGNISIDEADSNFINMLEGDPYFDGDETQLMFQKAIRTLPENKGLFSI